MIAFYFYNRLWRRIFGVFNRFEKIRVLDIGCGNHSVTVIKRMFPNCVYTGIDITDAGYDDNDFKLMDKFVLLSKEDFANQISKIGEEYNLVLLFHILEHTKNPEDIVLAAAQKVAPGGMIAIAYPSLSSVNNPRSFLGVNFHDDVGHIRIVHDISVINLLLDNGFKIRYVGNNSDSVRDLHGLLRLGLFAYSRLIKGSRKIVGLWSLYRFERIILAVRQK
jgi:SAM-dependent methyltransferase